MKGGFFSGSLKAARALLTRTVRIECDRLPHKFERVPMRKILNWILVEASIHFRTLRPWGWPTHLQVEPSSHCNLRCTLCPVTEGLDRPAGHMSFDLLRKLVDDVSRPTSSSSSCGLGRAFPQPGDLRYDLLRQAQGH